MDQLRTVFTCMRQSQLFAKRSKCDFAVPIVEYLGHFISAVGVVTDPSKVVVVSNMPTPKTLKQLKGFLGLASYYRRFVRNYGIARPLSNLLKKDGFVWSEEATTTFNELKQALVSAHVLALPDFNY